MKLWMVRPLLQRWVESVGGDRAHVGCRSWNVMRMKS